MTHRQLMKIGDIIPYKKNPRKNNDSVDDVANSIRDFGYLQPIVVDRNNVVIVGHTRLKALQKLGRTEVEVVVADDLDDKQADAYRIADNKVGEKSIWDDELLSQEIQRLQDDIDMTQYGFSDEDVQSLIASADEEDTQPSEDVIPNAPTEAVSKRGQIYQLGRHRLMCGDSTSAEDIIKLMAGTRADITFTSPPYNANTLDSNEKISDSHTHKKYLNDDDDVSDEEYQAFIERNMDLILEHSKEVFYNIGVAKGSKRTVIRLLNDYIDEFKDFIYWMKTNPTPHIDKHTISSATELIMAFSKDSGSRKFHHRFGFFNGVISGVNAMPQDYASIHKATFPLYLPTEIINRFTDEGATVLDCFGGTGTTLIACEDTNRICYMMEIEPIYVDVIIQRWEARTGQKAQLL